MTVKYGSLGIIDTLQSVRIFNGTVLEYGIDEMYNNINAAFAAHNGLIGEQVDLFCDKTTMRFMRTGGTDYMDMDELDEFGVAQSQKIGTGAEQGFPVRRFGRGLQWNEDYFRRTEAKDFAIQVVGIMTADLRNIGRRIQMAFTNPVNYTFIDRLTDGASLPVKALQNNDPSFPIPIGPYGKEFATSHNHYLAYATLTDTAAVALTNTVIEHFNEGDYYVAIASTDADAWKALTGFTAYEDVRIIQGIATDHAAGKLNMTNLQNRAIGLYNGTEVWVKPWGIANYPICYAVGANRKPLVIRCLGGGKDGTKGSPSFMMGGSSAGIGDLRLVAQFQQFPLYANQYQREFDVAVKERVAAAVLYIGGTTYVAPTL